MPQGPGLGFRPGPGHDSHLLESLDGGLAIIEFSLQIRCTDLDWPRAEAMKQLDDGIGNTLVSVCGNPLPPGPRQIRHEYSLRSVSDCVNFRYKHSRDLYQPE